MIKQNYNSTFNVLNTISINKKISILALLLCSIVYGQHIVDSLNIRNLKPSQALIRINKELKFKNLTLLDIANLNEYKADVLKNENNVYAAIDTYKESLSVYKLVKNKIRVLNKIATVYIELEDFSKAITVLSTIENLAEELRSKNDFESSRYFVNMGNMFMKTGKLKKAKTYFLRAIQLEKTNSNQLLLNSHYLEYTSFLIHQKKLDSALYYSNLVIGYSKNHDDNQLLAKAHVLKGEIYEYKNDFILAEKQYKKAIYLLNKLHSNSAFIYKKMGNFYKKVYLYDYADKNLRIAARKISKENKIDELQDLYHDLVENSLLQHRFKKSQYYLHKFDSVHSILEKIIEKKNIAYINDRYKIQQAEIEYINDRNALLKKESELINQKRIAKKNRTINLIIIILSIVLAFGIYTYYKFYKLNIEKSNIKLKNTVLRLQMNPHFIFNSLTAIQNSILKNDPLKSAELIAIFSKLIRQNLDFSTKRNISLTDEIDMLRNYLETQKFRFNDLFDFSIDIDSNVDCDHTEIPPMLLQPFIENAIEHGLKHRKKNGKVTIQITKIEKGIKVVIQDNGVGRKSAEIHNKNHDDKDKIHAIKIFKERLKIRQKKEIESFKISDIIDTKNEVQGTKVEFIIKE